MSENDNSQPDSQPTKNKEQPPKKIGRPVITELVNSKQQPITSESSSH